MTCVSQTSIGWQYRLLVLIVGNCVQERLRVQFKGRYPDVGVQRTPSRWHQRQMQWLHMNQTRFTWIETSPLPAYSSDLSQSQEYSNACVREIDMFGDGLKCTGGMSRGVKHLSWSSMTIVQRMISCRFSFIIGDELCLLLKTLMWLWNVEQ